MLRELPLLNAHGEVTDELLLGKLPEISFCTLIDMQHIPGSAGFSDLTPFLNISDHFQRMGQVETRLWCLLLGIIRVNKPPCFTFVRVSLIMICPND